MLAQNAAALKRPQHLAHPVVFRITYSVNDIFGDILLGIPADLIHPSPGPYSLPLVMLHFCVIKLFNNVI